MGNDSKRGAGRAARRTDPRRNNEIARPNKGRVPGHNGVISAREREADFIFSGRADFGGFKN